MSEGCLNEKRKDSIHRFFSSYSGSDYYEKSSIEHFEDDIQAIVAQNFTLEVLSMGDYKGYEDTAEYLSLAFRSLNNNFFEYQGVRYYYYINILIY